VHDFFSARNTKVATYLYKRSPSEPNARRASLSPHPNATGTPNGFLRRTDSRGTKASFKKT